MILRQQVTWLAFTLTLVACSAIAATFADRWPDQTVKLWIDQLPPRSIRRLQLCTKTASQPKHPVSQAIHRLAEGVGARPYCLRHGLTARHSPGAAGKALLVCRQDRTRR